MGKREKAGEERKINTEDKEERRRGESKEKGIEKGKRGDEEKERE